MKQKKHKSKHDIYLSDEMKDDTKIVIKGNKLNLRWFDKAILVWSEKNGQCLPKKFLEIIEKVLEEDSHKV